MENLSKIVSWIRSSSVFPCRARRAENLNSGSLAAASLRLASDSARDSDFGPALGHGSESGVARPSEPAFLPYICIVSLCSVSRIHRSFNKDGPEVDLITEGCKRLCLYPTHHPHRQWHQNSRFALLDSHPLTCQTPVRPPPSPPLIPSPSSSASTPSTLQQMYLPWMFQVRGG